MAVAAGVEQQQLASRQRHTALIGADLQLSSLPGGAHAVQKARLKRGLQGDVAESASFDQVEGIPVLLAVFRNAASAGHFPQRPTRQLAAITVGQGLQG